MQHSSRFLEPTYGCRILLSLPSVFSWAACASVSRQFMKGPQAALTTGLFLVLIYGKALNATHHWFAVLLVLLAVRINMPRVPRTSIALSGALLGLATFF